MTLPAVALQEGLWRPDASNQFPSREEYEMASWTSATPAFDIDELTQITLQPFAGFSNFKKFLIIWRPFSVRMLSGWNWTPQIG